MSSTECERIALVFNDKTIDSANWVISAKAYNSREEVVIKAKLKNN